MPNLATKLVLGQPTYAYDYSFMTNSPLVVLDARGAAHPRLASELPSQERGTWTVNPDGTMATTWKIRSNAVWHDGQPVAPGDFALALKIYVHPEIETQDREPERLISHIEPVDRSTFTIHWKATYPLANRLIFGQLEPLPEHLVGALYDAGDPTAFQTSPFFTSVAYVGNGPYRLVEWEKGVHRIYRASDQYYLGRPKIDEVVFRIIPDPTTVVANVLSGAVDLTVNIALNQAAAATVKQEWERSGEGGVISMFPFLFRGHIQSHPARARPTDLRDVRIRRAIVHAIDRSAVSEVVSGGRAPEATVLINPDDPLHPRVRQEIATYAFNPTRALALLQEGGWTRSGSGALVSARAEPFDLEIRTPDAGDQRLAISVIGKYLSDLGMQITENVHPPALQDREFLALYSGLYVASNLIDIPKNLGVYTSSQCPRAETRWFGSNAGCWNNPTYDHLFEIATTSLDAKTRDDATVQMFKILTEEVGMFGMSYHVEDIAVRKGLVGPAPRWPVQRGNTWDIHQWYWS
jgi:peptide/nickel transport system substrate-binding protein